MDSIIDYVKKNGEYSILEMPFNEVDSLCLAQFSYLKINKSYEELLRQGEMVTPEKIATSDYTDELFSDERFRKNNIELFDAMASSKRFGNMKIFEYVDISDPQWELQFSAMTFILDNTVTYVAFRGTDEYLYSWKEDFNMAYMTPIPAQIKAVQYLNYVGNAISGNIIVGGHSKGGNLAVYASMNAVESVRNRITDIYSHDGPGFQPEVLESEAFQKISDRIKKLVPRSSIVGLCLQDQENYEVVVCKYFGILQHDSYNWIVDGCRFVRGTNVHKMNEVRIRTINSWILDMDYEKRQDFVQMLFEILSGCGTDNLNDFKGEFLIRTKGMLNSYNALDDKEKEMLQGVLKDLTIKVNETARDNLTEQINEEREKYKQIIDEGNQRFNQCLDYVIKTIENLHK